MRRLRSHGNAEVDHTPFNSGTTPIREYGLARSNGGQRQRIMVARALMLHPKIIIADEPVSMVDASLRATILENLRELNQVHGISILYITHDPPTAYQIADNIVVLYQGRVAESGDVEKVIKDPQHPYTQLLVDSTFRSPTPRPAGASPPPCCSRAQRQPARNVFWLRLLLPAPVRHAALPSGRHFDAACQLRFLTNVTHSAIYVENRNASLGRDDSRFRRRHGPYSTRSVTHASRGLHRRSGRPQPVSLHH